MNKFEWIDGMIKLGVAPHEQVRGQSSLQKLEALGKLDLHFKIVLLHIIDLPSSHSSKLDKSSKRVIFN